jgi:phosphate transport system ATP-binding protein
MAISNTEGVLPMSPCLVIKDLSVSYDGKVALQRASFEVPAGELMALVGPSGCGKSSLLHSINRINASVPGCEVTGEVLLAGRPVSWAPEDLPALRRRVGMVFQQPNPFPLSIRENIHFPLREHGSRLRRQRDEIMEDVLLRVGLWREVRDRLDGSALALSGGQQQRLCIARALALEPEVFLLDEPCSALDPMASAVVEELIGSLKGDYTILMVTHNLAQARRLADQVTVCWVQDGCGCVIESGASESIFINGHHPVTRAYCAGECG